MTASNQLWEVDIKYGYIAGENRFFFVSPSLTFLTAALWATILGCAAKLKMLWLPLKEHFLNGSCLRRQKLVIRSDNGPQFISNLFDMTCRELSMEHERIPFKTPNLNAHIESFHSILEEECLSRHEFSSYAEAYETVTGFIWHYNNVRIHSATHYLAPAECYQLLMRNQMHLKPVRL